MLVHSFRFNWKSTFTCTVSLHMSYNRNGPSANYAKKVANRGYSAADLAAREQQITAARALRVQERKLKQQNVAGPSDPASQPTQNTANNSSVAQPAENRISETLGLQQPTLPVPHSPRVEVEHQTSENSPRDHTAEQWLSAVVDSTLSGIGSDLSKSIELTRNVAQKVKDESQENQSLNRASSDSYTKTKPRNKQASDVQQLESLSTDAAALLFEKLTESHFETVLPQHVDTTSSTSSVSQPTRFQQSINSLDDAKLKDNIAHASSNHSGVTQPAADLLDYSQISVDFSNPWLGKVEEPFEYKETLRTNTCNNVADAIPAEVVPTVPAQAHCAQSNTDELALVTITDNVCLKSFSNLRRDILDPLYDACIWNEENQEWIIPSLHTELEINKDYWRSVLGANFPARTNITKCVATFYHDEPDHNREFKPRLDIVLSFSNGTEARYHPKAKLIWSYEYRPTEAMQQRYRLAAKIANTDGENSS